MSATLLGKRIAILATNGFEQSELLDPKNALENAGAETDVISPEQGKIRGWDTDNWGQEVEVDVVLSEANPDKYDALLLPGGVMNPDTLRRIADAQRFVQRFQETHKPIAAICHGPWTLIDAGLVEGRRMTSYHTLQTDLQNAGAQWVDEKVVVDDNLITSRKPSDLPAFIEQMIKSLTRSAVTPVHG